MLDRGTSGPLTLVSALAGSGKTVALTSWAAALRPKPWLAWLSLEAQDADTTRFWSHILASIRLALPSTLRTAISSIAPPRAGAGERFQARLIEAIGALPRELILVVDDAQEITHGEAGRDLERLVRLAPENLRVVLSTSSDPQMSLPRLRARGSVVEIRARDLAFSPTETAEMMTGLGIHLSPEQVLLLTHRTEGWAAALKLASASLRDRTDRDEFIREFAGNDRTIADYLVEEVLGRVPEHLQRFLLRTSIVERFNAGVAAALTEDDEAGRSLEALEHDYSLVVPLGDGEWYRYHRLLRQILPALLAYEQPDEVPLLHGIAARWFAEHGMVVESVRHAAAAGDGGLTSRYLADVNLTYLIGPESIPLRALVAEVPSIRAAHNSGVATTAAGSRLSDGDPEGALRLIESGREAPLPRGAGHAHRVRARSASVAASAAREMGDVARVLEETRPPADDSVTDMSSDERKYLEAILSATRGWALLWSGESGHARADLEEGVAAARAAHVEPLRLASHAQLALLEMMLGRVAVGHGLARSALSQADDSGLTEAPEAAGIYLALAWAHDERGEPDAAEGFLESGHDALRAGDVRDMPTSAIEACMLARIHRWRGRPNVGANLLSATRRRMRDRALGNLSGFVAVEEAAMHLASGAPTLAARALSTAPRDTRPTGQIVVRARLLRADGGDEDAAELLRKHLDREPASHLPDLVDAHVLLASLLAAGDTEASWDVMERALHLADAHGIARPFLLQDDGADLLKTQLVCGTAHEDLCRELLARIEALAPAPPAEPLVEPLSERERTVLRCMATLLSVEEISNELFVSVNTVKTHVKHIYRKLGVARRRDAVERGRALHLIPSETARTA